MSAVPQPTLTPTGFSVPSESAVLEGCQTDIDAAFGGGLNDDLTTPQGQIASSEAAIIGDANDQFLEFASAIDPATSTGRYQDALYQLYFLERNPATSTVVTCTLTGIPDTVIGEGLLAIDNQGNTYANSGSVTISSGGTVSADFANVTPGPIPCPADTLTQIYNGVTGWNTINNPDDGVLGSNVETPQAFYLRYQASVAGNSFGAIGSIIGAVAQVPDVLDYYGYDNGEDTPVTVQNVTIAANSIYLCVEGGTDLAVAQAILSKKAPGCAYTGSDSVTAYDDNPLYASPIPYTVKFTRPTALPIYFAVSVLNTAAVPSNYLTLIQNAIQAAFAGTSSLPNPPPRARIAAILVALNYAPAIQALGAWAQNGLISIFVGSNLSTSSAFTGVISGTALSTSGATGTIAVGQFVEGAGVAPGTMIVSGSGSSWVVNISQTVSSESMVGIDPNLADLLPDADLIPTLNIADIVVTLV